MTLTLTLTPNWRNQATLDLSEQGLEEPAEMSTARALKSKQIKHSLQLKLQAFTEKVCALAVVTLTPTLTLTP